MNSRKLGILFIILGGATFAPLVVWTSVKEEFDNVLIVVFCISAMLLLNIGFGLLPIKKKYSARKHWAISYLITGLLILTVAGLLKYFHKPGAGICIIEGVFFLCSAYIPLLIKNRYEKWLNYTENRKLLLLLCLGDLFSIVLILLGGLFKLQFWPGAYILLVSGPILLALTLLGWNQVFKYVVKKRKEAEERAKAAYKEITDSITYAKRIQSAKLPDKNEIKKALPNSFVLFKPKDIVSGDFYYFHKNNSSVFIASADCTGHGVPGAFMSMIGSEKLDDALTHSADTSEILAHLNKGIKISLKQSDSDESTRDGMDIALCSVDTDNSIVKYAGANRPLWIIRNGLTAVEEIKATKKAIGGFTEDNQHFDTHVIQLQQGDTFYISTDGYADTFGGQENKKLTTKRFKEILLSIQDKSMKDQELHLDNFVENWKAGTEQVDDILVIGVRL